MPPHYFWNLVLTINSVVLTCLSVLLIYAFGMLILELNWKLFLMALVAWAVDVGIEIILAALTYEY